MSEFTVNPFESEAQRAWMYANHPAMAKRWAAHTPKGKKLPSRVTANRRKTAARIDPSRTFTLRRSAQMRLRQRFKLLKGKIVRLVLIEDAFGLKRKPRNPLLVPNALEPVLNADRTIAIDFDGRIAPFNEHAPIAQLQPRPGTRTALEHFKDMGLQIVVWTARPDWMTVGAWMRRWQLPFDAVNGSPDGETGSRKIKAAVYLDDRGEGDPDATWPELVELVDERFSQGDSPRQPTGSKHELFDRAAEARDELRQLLERAGFPTSDADSLPLGGLEQLVNGAQAPVALLAPTKTEERATEKVNREYGGDWSRLLDVARASVVCKSLAELKAAKAALDAASPPLRTKDRFAAPHATGYRDVMANYRLPCGLVAEVQFHLKPILIAREKQHIAYSVVRTIKSEMSRGGRRKMTDAERAAVKKAKQEGRALLDRAWDEARAADPTLNAFCPTGEGGGVDPSCGSHTAVYQSALRGDLSHEDMQAHFAKLDDMSKSEVHAAAHELGLAGVKNWTRARAIQEVKQRIADARSSALRQRMNEGTLNAFCPTGEGGGVDPTCSPGGASHGVEVSGGHLLRPEHLAEVHMILHETEHRPKSLSIVSRGGGNWHGITEDQGDAVRLSAKYMHNIERGSTVDDSRRGLLTHEMGHVFAAKVGIPLHVMRSTEYKQAAQKLSKQAGKDEDEAAAEFYVAYKMGKPGVPKLLSDWFSRHGVKQYSKSLTANAGRWTFASDSEKLRAFQAWLKQQFMQGIIDDDEEEVWRRYAEDGWRKGAGRAYDDVMRKHRQQGQPTEPEEAATFYAGGKAEFMRSMSAPVAIDKVKLLASRSFTDLKGVTERMATMLARTLADGLVQGLGARELTKNLTNAVDIEADRAEMIARTEIIRAHAEGQLDAMEDLGVENVEAQVEWSTAQDEAVCPECEGMEGTIMSIDDARGLIPAHPNCRCAWIPAVAMGIDLTK